MDFFGLKASPNGNGAAVAEHKDAGPVIDASSLRFPSADFWPTDNRQGTMEVQSLVWYAASWLAYSCMRYRATKLVEPPLWVTDEKDGEEAWIKGGHPIEELLQRPNPDMSLTDLLELTSLYLDSTPGCVWHKVRDRGGRVARLYPYSGDEFTVESAPGDDGTTRIFGRYRLTPEGGRGFTAVPEDVVHFRNAHPSDLHLSLPPLHAALARLGIEQTLVAATKAGLRNSIRPGGSIRFEGTLTELQKEEFKRSLREQYEQARNHGKALVTGNATYTPHEMGFSGLAGGDISREGEAAVCAVFQVHPAMIGTLAGLENSSDKHNMDAVVAMFYDNMVFPAWAKWEDTLTTSLLRDFDTDKRHFLRFDKTRIRALKEDIADKAVVVAGLRMELDLDERRALLGYAAATPEQRAEVEANRPAAFSGFGVPAKSLPPRYTKAVPRATLWALRDATVRGQEFAWELAARAQLEEDKSVVLKLAAGMLRSVKASGTDPESIRKLIAALRDAPDFEKAWAKLVKPLIQGTAKRAVEAVANDVGISFDLLQPGLAKYVDGHAAQLVTNITETTRTSIIDALRVGLDAGDGISELTKRIEESGAFSASRAELIARTETTTVSNNAGVESLRDWASENNAKAEKSWLSARDSRVREEHAFLDDGTWIPVDDEFANGLDAPGEPGCRCTLLYRIAED